MSDPQYTDSQHIRSLEDFRACVIVALASLRPALDPRAEGEERLAVTVPGYEAAALGLREDWEEYRRGTPFPALMDRVIRSLEDIGAGTFLAAGWAESREALRLRLMPLATVERLVAEAIGWNPGEGRAALLHRPWRDGLTLVLTLDMPSSFACVGTGHLAAWERDPVTVWGVAYDRTLAAVGAMAPDETTRFGWRMRVWDGRNAASRLALPELWRNRG